MEKAEEWDYDGIKANTKIPLGIFYQKEKEVFEKINKIDELKNRLHHLMECL